MANGFPVKANYATGDILTATNMNELSATLNYLQYMPPRNPVLNSSFNVWQRGTTFTTVGGVAYTADRWVSRTGGVGGSVVTTRDTSAPTGFQYSAKLRRSTGNTDTNPLQLFQSFETVNSLPFAGKTVTLSFYAKAGANYSGASSSFGSGISYGTGTDQIYYSYTGNVDNNQSNTLTTSWQRFTQTVTLPSTATEITTLFYYSPVGTAGADDSFYVTGVQIELGSAANTYMSNQPTYQGELAACQRYYYRATATNYNQGWSMGQCYSTTQAFGVIPFPVQMRSVPTALEQNGTAGDYKLTTSVFGGATCTSVPTFNAATYNSATVVFTVGSGLTAGNATSLQSGQATGYLGWSAEL